MKGKRHFEEVTKFQICLRGQFSLSHSKAEDGDTSPGSGTSDKPHEETKHG